MLQNIYDTRQNISREEQAEQMFDSTQELLKEYSASYRNVVRTWIYLADILDWYSEFNKVRNMLNIMNLVLFRTIPLK